MKTRPYFPITAFLFMLGSYILVFLLLTCLIALFLSACGDLSPSDFNTILSSQPYVIDLKPAPYQILDRLEKIEVIFSKPVSPETVSDTSIFVVEGALDPKSSSEPDSIQDDVEDGNLQTVPGSLTLSPDAQTITWVPQENVEGGSVTLVITPELTGENKVPFNQQPGEDPTAFVSTYYLASGSGSSSPSSPNSSTSESPGSSTPKIRPDFLVLNEVLYDAAISDTDGNEFIELYGTPNADLDGYQAVLVNGADGSIIKAITLPENTKMGEDGIFLIADARTNQNTVTNILGADLIENFDPQNGPDAIQLLDHQGHLLDAMAYGTGNVPQAKNGLATGEGAPAPDVGEGHSLSRVEGKDTDENSVDFVDLSVPTPGIP